MKPIPIKIPIKAAELIAKEYGYDQVIIFARKVGGGTDPHGEHLTTYGISTVHCGVASQVGEFLKTKILKWFETPASVMGKAGGKARVKKLSPERRKEIAKQAANTRWSKTK